MESIQHITPRWEWRRFDAEPIAEADHLHQLTLLRTSETRETYILIPDSNFNLKIRNEQFEIKQLIERSSDMLEKWMPIFKSGFPLIDFDWSPWSELNEYLGDLQERPVYNAREFCDRFREHREVHVVMIRKLRQVFGHGMTHFDSVIINADEGQNLFSLACEDENQNNVREWVGKLGFDLSTNQNYIRALKKLRGV